MAVQIFSGIIIARLLLPEEMGVFSVAAAVLGFVHMFRDFGINSYIVQEKELTDSRLRAAFTLNLFISWSLGVAVYFSSPFAAQFYETQGIMEVLKITSLIFFLIPFGAISVAMLQRNMQFGKLNIINLSGSLSGAIVSIYCAYLGFSYISLAWGTLANSTVSILVVQFFRHPVTLYPSFKDIRKVLGYGSITSITHLVDYLGSSAPDLILGKILTMSDVGIFGRATGLISLVQRLIISAIKPVLLPYLSNIQDSKEQLKTQYLYATDLMIGLAWPALGFLIVKSALIIEVLYGSNWLAAVPLVKILGMAYFFIIFTSLSDELFKSSGQIKTFAKITFVITPLGFLAVLMSAPYGLTNVALALACIPVIKVLITTFFIKRQYKIQYRLYLPIAWRNGLLTSFPLCMVYLFNSHYSITPMAIDLLSTAATFSVVWLITIFLLNHPLSIELKKALKRSPTKHA